MTKTPLISICIPSYNRPDTLSRLLKSIDAKDDKDIEIVVCEDKSPRRSEVKKVVEQYKKNRDTGLIIEKTKIILGTTRILEN